LQKFAEILASQCAPPVSTTAVANLSRVSTTPEAKLPLLSTTLAGKFATSLAGVADNGGKQGKKYQTADNLK
jgi:hypothetical protein